MTTWTFITGASTGIGVEFARLAARDGHNIILTARSKDKLNALASDLAGDGREIVVIPADLSRLDEAERLWAEATDGRQINVLVNNAGLGSHGDFADGQNWQREMDSINVNMLSLTYLMKQAIPHMQAIGKGRVLNVSSVAGFAPGPNMAVYCASKAYVLSLTEAVAEELAGSKVTVTALCPGATATEFFDAADMGGVRLLEQSKPMSAKAVAEDGWMAARIGKRIIVPGGLNKVFTFLPRVMPRSVLTRMGRNVMAKQ